MSTLDKIRELRAIVSQYTTESFAGFFSYFIRQRPDDSEEIALNKFDSKLKDFFFIIGLNAFSNKKGNEIFELNQSVIADIAEKLNSIKDDYRVSRLPEYTMETVIHEMAFRNHFDNGVLSYVEQDLEKIRTVLTRYNAVIESTFGFDVDFLIEVYKATELVAKIRFDHVMEFSRTEEYQEMQRKIMAKEITIFEGINMLSKPVQDGWHSFAKKSHAYLLFSKEDLYPMFPKDKIDNFLKVFSCKPVYKDDFNYYTDSNPLELAPILEVESNKYLHICQKQIPIAVYRFLYNYLLQLDKTYFDKVRRHREQSLESKAKDIFKSFLPKSESFFYENYYLENNCEQDLLILTRGIALIIETKASKLREPFRNIEKAIERLKADFKNCIQYGYDQCRRVEKYFQNGKRFSVRSKDGTLLYVVDPHKYHSVFSVVVTLERFGSLQTDLNLLLQKEKNQNFPWSVYIDDLETFLLGIKESMRNPHAQFFQFLRQRQLLHGGAYSIDELDICGYYLGNPQKFEALVKSDSTIFFSPKEQEIFDQMYYAGKLKFKEEVSLEIPRYFNKPVD